MIQRIKNGYYIYKKIRAHGVIGKYWMLEKIILLNGFVSYRIRSSLFKCIIIGRNIGLSAKEQQWSLWVTKLLKRHKTHLSSLKWSKSTESPIKAMKWLFLSKFKQGKLWMKQTLFVLKMTMGGFNYSKLNQHFPNHFQDE